MVHENEFVEMIPELFDDAERFHIPVIAELPPERPLRDGKRLNSAQNGQISVESCVPIDTFLSREIAEIKEYETSFSVSETDFRETLESYENVVSDNDQVRTDLPGTAFEHLHGPRNFVYRTSQFRKSFERNGYILERFMDQCDIARLPNAMKRIKKGESVNLRLPRYSAEQIKKRMHDKNVSDLFGHLSLIPHSLNKSNKSSYQRKLMVLVKFHDMMQNFDYSKRSGYEEKRKLSGIQKKISELQAFIDTLKSQPLIRSAPKTSDLLKRKLLDSSDPMIPKKIKKESRPIASSSSHERRDNPDVNSLAPIPRRDSKESRSNEELASERTQKVVRNIDPSVERERMLREKRKEAAMKREAEYFEKQNKAKEEYAKQQAAERAEIERKKKELEKQRAEHDRELERQEEERRQAAIRKAEECRMYREREAERKRKLEEERKQREVAAELEKLKRKMQETVQENEIKPSQVPEVTVWKHLLVKKPSNWSKRKEKFFDHYDWPTDEAQREIERVGFPKPPQGFQINIPHENNSRTKVTPLSMPKLSFASKSSSSVALRTPGPLVPVYRPADDKILEKIVQDIKNLMAPSQKSIANFLSLTKKEVDYQGIEIHKLKRSMTYPFAISDGLYWPLLFTLEEQTNICHVRSLAVCNSFSGKYASRYLLTTPLQEDSYSKKFDANFRDCGGDWAEYSQKPGRFSKRCGYKAHYSKSNDSYDVQRQRARDKLNSDYANERREQDAFGRYLDQHRQRGSDRGRNRDYRNHVTTHLRTLVKDARIDVYSLKENHQNTEYDYDRRCHPGTRQSPTPLRWHNHGYKIYLKTRNREFVYFVNEATERYESLLRPRYSPNVDQFNQWCFTPMLVSLHYQSKYGPYDVFSSREMKELSDRYKTYHGLLRERKFSLERAIKVCRLTPLDKKQWTILHDQLVSHFRDFPAIFHLMFDRNGNMIRKVDEILHKLMENEFRDRSNAWFFDTRMYSNRRIS